MAAPVGPDANTSLKAARYARRSIPQMRRSVGNFGEPVTNMGRAAFIGAVTSSRGPPGPDAPLDTGDRGSPVAELNDQWEQSKALCARCFRVRILRGWNDFSNAVDAMVPTVLCWADLTATEERLAQRGEDAEPVAWTEHHLAHINSLEES